jgi:hypothetical protein
MTQVVPEQAGVPFCTAQTAPQPPQAFTLFVVAVSHPFATLLSQLPKPAAHMIEQAPPEHDGAPFWPLHWFPHPPQLAVLTAVLTSQPFTLLMSQSANAPLHATSSHVPVAHVAVAFGRAQATPQPPQLVRVFRLVSQPFAYWPSQSAKPAAQDATKQVPPAQLAVPFAAKQARPQPPQCWTLFVVLVSQPLTELPSQSPKPAAQLETVHWLFEHAGVPPCGGHTLLHAPQLLTLVVVLISQPFPTAMSQFWKPALQAIEHWPPAHDGTPLFALHAAPQPPQFAALVLTLTSQPFAWMPSQSAKPALHEPTTQLPFEQAAVAFGTLQTRPHIPQLAAAVLRLVSQPSWAMRLQSAKGGAHWFTAHAPAAHALLALGSEQTKSHEPQFCASAWMFTSQPLPATVSQSTKPAWQLPIEQAPPWQTSFAFGRTQGAPQAPQLSTLTVVATSHPFGAIASQLP